MGRGALWWLLPAEMLAMMASATGLGSRSTATQTVYDAATQTTTLMRLASPEPTAEIGVMELFARQDDPTYSMSPGTCGFGGSERPWVTYVCYDEDAVCQTIADYYGCCVGGTSSCLATIHTACENYQTSTTCGNYYHTRCCDATFPYCLTYLWEDGKTIFDCEASETTTPVTMLGTPWAWLESHSMTDVESSTSSTPTSSSSSSTSTLPTPTTSTSSSASASADAGGSSDGSSGGGGGSSDNTGAIVGGVVGGVAVIALIGLGIFFMKRYFKKRDAAAAAAGAGATGAGPGTGAQSGPSEMDTVNSPSTAHAATTPSTFYSTAAPGVPQQGGYPGYGHQQQPGQEWYKQEYAYAGGYPQQQGTPMAEAPAEAPLGHEHNRAELGGFNYGPGHTSAELR